MVPLPLIVFVLVLSSLVNFWLTLTHPQVSGTSLSPSLHPFYLTNSHSALKSSFKKIPLSVISLILLHWIILFKNYLSFSMKLWALKKQGCCDHLTGEEFLSFPGVTSITNLVPNKYFWTGCRTNTLNEWRSIFRWTRVRQCVAQ